jgi:alpha-galactosidase
MTEIRHIEGLYAMWDELRKRHPGLVTDNCASGGRRIDLETCMRGLPLWHSDMQCSGPNAVGDQLQNAGLFRWIPMHGCGNFGYEPSYLFRSAMTAGNILVAGNAEGRLSTADPATEDSVKRTVAIYKKIRPYMVGDFYPLFHHSDSQEVWFGYQFHRRDLDAGVAIFFRRGKSPDPTAGLSIHMNDRSARYEIEYEDTGEKKIVAGSAPVEVNVPTAPGSAIVFYRRLKP